MGGEGEGEEKEKKTFIIRLLLFFYLLATRRMGRCVLDEVLVWLSCSKSTRYVNPLLGANRQRTPMPWLPWALNVWYR